MKKNKKGFTLIEILVVVLIIGVLAAIAVPQYKFAIARSKYNTIKEMTESLAKSVERYYLTNSIPPINLEVLDIDIPGEYQSDAKIRKNLPTGELCGFNAGSNNQQELICFTKIFGTDISYLSTVYYNQSRRVNHCYAFSTNTTDLVNKVCQADTGKSSPYTSCTSYYCPYKY